MAAWSRLLQNVPQLSNHFTRAILARNKSNHVQDVVFFTRISSLWSRHFSISTAEQQKQIITPNKTVVSPNSPVRIVTESLPELICSGFKKNAKKVALVCAVSGRTYTYEQVEALFHKFGSALLRRGYKKGDVIAILCPNIPEFAPVFLGAVGAGLVVTTVNPTYTPGEIRTQLEDCSACVLVTIPALSAQAKEAVAGLKAVKEIISIGEAEGCTPLATLLSDSGSLYPTGRIDVNGGEDLLVLPYSSGTTGKPKGVMLTHKNVGTNLLQYVHPDAMGVTEDDVLMAILPFYHSYGLMAILLTSLYAGTKLVCMPKFDPDVLLNVLRTQKLTMFHLVPPLLQFLLMNPAVQKQDLSSLHHIMCAAAPLSQNLVTAMAKKADNPQIIFREGWGMTEISPVGTIEPWKNPVLGWCGVPVSNTEIKVVNDSGQALGPGEEGEMWIRGPQIMKGYHSNPTATAEMIDNDGWLKTGDIGRYNEDGRFQIVDRLKELIKVKGLQVAPAELEDLLLSQPDVKDAAVIGVPDSKYGEVPRAYVIRKNPDLTEDSLAAWVAGKVAPHKRLAGGIRFVDSIPKTPTGKILRKELRKEAAEERK